MNSVQLTYYYDINQKSQQIYIIQWGFLLHKIFSNQLTKIIEECDKLIVYKDTHGNEIGYKIESASSDYFGFFEF